MFEIQSVLHEINMNISEYRIKKKVLINMDLDESCKMRIISFQQIVETIYQNLILSALEKCQRDQTIHVFLRIENLELLMDIVDEGTGMTNEDVVKAQIIPKQVGNNKNTEVTLTIKYERLLDPVWYFGPLQEYGVKKTADYLIDKMMY